MTQYEPMVRSIRSSERGCTYVLWSSVKPKKMRCATVCSGRVAATLQWCHIQFYGEWKNEFESHYIDAILKSKLKPKTHGHTKSTPHFPEIRNVQFRVLDNVNWPFTIWLDKNRKYGPIEVCNYLRTHLLFVPWLMLGALSALTIACWNQK